MIFVTVGTQLTFDRMIRAVDAWAGRTGRKNVIAQTGPSTYLPKNIEAVPFMTAEECRAHVEEASVVIAHAGMGSVITALELGKPIIIMPRRVELGEHRNDHQMATAKCLLQQGRVIVAFDEEHLCEKLDRIDLLRPAGAIGKSASPRLVNVLRSFIGGATAAIAPLAGELAFAGKGNLDRPLFRRDEQEDRAGLELAVNRH